MTDGVTNIAGIEIPSTDPTFLIVVAVHILLGLGCTVAGIVAMLSQKSARRHPRFGTIYFWSLVGVFVTMTGLATVRWAEDYHLFILGLLSLTAAYLGREARRQHWGHWVQLHITGIGTSYILLLTAFYVDNGKNLPLWNQLPYIAYWLIPAAHHTRSVLASVGALAALCSAESAPIAHRGMAAEAYAAPAQPIPSSVVPALDMIAGAPHYRLFIAATRSGTFGNSWRCGLPALCPVPMKPKE